MSSKNEPKVQKKPLANPSEIDLVLIPDGKYAVEVGTSIVNIRISTFLIEKYPNTNKQYRVFNDCNPDRILPSDWDISERTFPKGSGKHPVTGLNWGGIKPEGLIIMDKVFDGV